MFVNGDAISLAIKLLAIGLLLLCLALVAHVAWLRGLTRSHALGHLSSTARIILLVFAAATPVVSFYAVETASRLRRLAGRHGHAGGRGVVFGAMDVVAVAVFVLVAIALLSQAVPGLHGPDVLSRLAGMLLVFAIPCAVLGMACQVLVRSSPALAGWIAAGITAACLILLV